MATNLSASNYPGAAEASATKSQQADTQAKPQVQNLANREFWAVEIPVGTRPDMCRGCLAHSDQRCAGVKETLEEPLTVAVYETQNRHPMATTPVKSACKTVIATSLRR